jgi:hypothetical protein
VETSNSLDSRKAQLEEDVNALVELSRADFPVGYRHFEPRRTFDIRSPFDGVLFSVLERGARELAQFAAAELLAGKKGVQILRPSERLAIRNQIFPFITKLWVRTGYDPSGSFGLRESEPARDPALKSLKKVLDDELRVLRHKSGGDSTRALQADASPQRTGGEAQRIPPFPSALFSSHRTVTVVRKAGTPYETRHTISAGGDFVEFLLVYERDCVKTGDELYSDSFAEPRVAARVDPVLLMQGVSHWRVTIIPRFEWDQSENRESVSRVPLAAIAPPALAQALPGLTRDSAGKAAQVVGTQEQLGVTKRGRPPDPQRRSAIREAISKQGGCWRDRLSEVFSELDDKRVDLGDFAGKSIDLGDGQTSRVENWGDLDLAVGDERARIIDALRKYK